MECPRAVEGGGGGIVGLGGGGGAPRAAEGRGGGGARGGCVGGVPAVQEGVGWWASGSEEAEAAEHPACRSSSRTAQRDGKAQEEEGTTVEEEEEGEDLGEVSAADGRAEKKGRGGLGKDRGGVDVDKESGRRGGASVFSRGCEPHGFFCSVAMKIVCVCFVAFSRKQRCPQSLRINVFDGFLRRVQ